MSCIEYMQRRDLLATLGGIGAVGLAGCLNRGTAGTARSRHVSIVNQDSIAEDHEIRIHAEVLESTITDAHPATLRISTTNEGPKRAISVRAGRCDLFNRGRGGSDEPRGLWLYRAESTDSMDQKGNRWMPDRSPDQHRAYATYGCAQWNTNPESRYVQNMRCGTITKCRGISNPTPIDGKRIFIFGKTQR